MARTHLVSTILCLTLAFPCLAYVNLYVFDPRTGGKGSSGTIENALIVAKPKGIYIEQSYYLTISGRSYNYAATDTLEIVYTFTLPEKAMIVDSWLWLNDSTISKGKMLDKWTASTIYENIVKRRRDPSILTKDNATTYTLRIFPLPGKQSRKIKLSFLIPADFSQTTVSSQLQTELLSPGSPALRWARFVVPKHEEFTAPSFVSTGLQSPLEAFNDPEFGDYNFTTLYNWDYKKENAITFNRKTSKDYYLSTHKIGKEGFYQLAFTPKIYFDGLSQRKINIALDYDESRSNLKKDELLNLIKNTLTTELSSNDYFNFTYITSLAPKQFSDNWVQATPTNIQEAITKVNAEMSKITLLPALLAGSLDFVKSKQDNGKIILITSTGNNTGWESSNEVLKELEKKGLNATPFIISDINSSVTNCNYISNIYYCNNEYLLTNLARLSKGSFSNRNSNSPSNNVIENIKLAQGLISNFDLYTRTSDGFCYNRYNRSSTANIGLTSFIYQVGKFHGDFPFKIEFTGEFNGNTLNKELVIQESEVDSNNDYTKLFWEGSYIQDKEILGQSNSNNVNDIIQHSVDNRILSLYTAFLCLEDTSYYCSNCVDETKYKTKNKDLDSLDKNLKVFPNPFTDFVNISLILNNANAEQDIVISILNAQGQLIHSITEWKLDENTLHAKWNGTFDNSKQVNPGIYICVVKTKQHTYKRKVVKL